MKIAVEAASLEELAALIAFVLTTFTPAPLPVEFVIGPVREQPKP